MENALHILQTMHSNSWDLRAANESTDINFLEYWHNNDPTHEVLNLYELKELEKHSELYYQIRMYSVMIRNYYPNDPLLSLIGISANMIDDEDIENLSIHISKHMESIASARTENECE